MEKISNLREAFTFLLKRLYHAEEELYKMLPLFIAQISSPSLKAKLLEYHDDSKQKLLKLENAFKLLHEVPVSRKNKVVTDLLHETKARLEDETQGKYRDILLIEAMQIIHHYETYDYNTCLHFASELDESKVKETLIEILNDLRKTEQVLDIHLDEITAASNDAVAARCVLTTSY